MTKIAGKTGGTLSLLFVLLSFAAVSEAKEWRGIKPLHSTRADVERLLGPPQKGSQSSYSTVNENVVVLYSVGTCAHGWNVPVGTVLSLSVYPKTPPKVETLGLDAPEYAKRRDLHVEYLYYYVDDKEGVNYTVDSNKGVATLVEYYPSIKDNVLRCAPTKPRPDPVDKEPRPQQQATALTTAERVRAMEKMAPTFEYTCVMHPDVHRAQEGKCPKCGMVLVQRKPAFEGEYPLVLAVNPKPPKAGAATRLRFQVFHPQTGEPVKSYVLNHEKFFHLFVVSHDLSIYQHLHPVLQRDGSFTTDVTFPLSGAYKLHGDFFPSGGTLQTFHIDMPTAGDPGASIPAEFTLKPDTTLVKTVDGLTARLEFSGGAAPSIGVLLPLKYILTDAGTGKPVQDLQPYLGAWGHTLILNEDQSEYLHSHPRQMVPEGPKSKILRGGPEVEFQTMFPSPGNYRIWTQFQRAGRVITVEFTVNVVD